MTKTNTPKQAKGAGLAKASKLKPELAALLGAKELPRTEIQKKIWDYIKANKLQTNEVNGLPNGTGRNIVADAKLLPIFNKTKSTNDKGVVTDFTNLKEGQTINMFQIAVVVSANLES